MHRTFRQLPVALAAITGRSADNKGEILLGRRPSEIEDRNNMNNKRVLMLRSNPIDPDPRVEKEADALMKDGFSVDVFCWDRSYDHPVGQTVKTLSNGNCNIYRVGIKSSFGSGFRKNLKPLMRFQLEIVKFLKANRKKYDAIHACDFDTALAGMLGSSKKSTGFIYDIFDYYADAFAVPALLKKIVVALDTHVINRADAVIICSEKRREQLGKARPKELAVIHNAPPQWEGANEGVNKSNSRFCIAYIGILSDGRLIPELLEIVSRHNEYELLIAGFGKYESLAREYAEKFGNISFLGRTDYSKTLEIENESDVMVAAYDPEIANHKYAAPNKFYEALMLGKPIIMCRGTGFSEIVEEQGIGVCIDYSERSLEEGLAAVKKDYTHFADKSSLEKDLFRREYSWDIMADRLTGLYRDLLR